MDILESPAKVHEGDEGIEASDVQSEPERAVTVQSGAEKAQGDLIHVYKYLMGGSKGAGPGSFQ